MAAVVPRARWSLWLAIVLVVAVLLTGGVLIWRIRRTTGGAAATLADEGDYVDASEYERLTGIAKESYERRLLVAAREFMMGDWTVLPDDVPRIRDAAYPSTGG